MKKTFSIVACAVALCAATALSAFAGFAKTKTYTEGTFTDLSQDKWYYNEVISAYELGFMNGTGADTFSAEGNVTVAQGITLAARVHSIYNGGTGEFTQGDVWYQVYVDYAIENGFVKEGQFDSYTRNIKRIEMATLFADALPEEEFAKKNKVARVPDVAQDNANYEKILMLYNAGIVMGSDDQGTFYPDNDIKRSEVSAIVNRVALPENRLEKTFEGNVEEEKKEEKEEEKEPEIVEISDKIINGDASDESNVAFKPYSDGHSVITIVKDPEDPTNSVYMNKVPEAKKKWTYFIQDVKYVPGATYRAEFDIKIMGTSDGNTDIDKVAVAFNSRYTDAEGNLEHTSGNIYVGTNDGWQHYTADFTIRESYVRDNDQFAIFANPVNELAVEYCIDNVKLTRLDGEKQAEETKPEQTMPAVTKLVPTDDKIVNGDASDENNLALYTVKEGNSIVTIAKDPTDPTNNVYKVEAPANKKVWAYCVQPIIWEAGATYTVEYDIMVVGTSDGSTDVDKTSIGFNAQYLEDNGTVDHPRGSKNLGTDDGWVHFKAQFTVNNSTDRSKDAFSVFSNPVGEYGVTYLIDNIKIEKQ